SGHVELTDQLPMAANDDGAITALPLTSFVPPCPRRQGADVLLAPARQGDARTPRTHRGIAAVTRRALVLLATGPDDGNTQSRSLTGPGNRLDRGRQMDHPAPELGLDPSRRSTPFANGLRAGRDGDDLRRLRADRERCWARRGDHRETQPVR